MSELLQPQQAASSQPLPIQVLKKLRLVAAFNPSASFPGPSLLSPHLPAIYRPQPSKVSELLMPPLLFLHCFVKSLFSKCELTFRVAVQFALFHRRPQPHTAFKRRCIIPFLQIAWESSPPPAPMMHLPLLFYFIILNTPCTVELAMS